MDLFNCGTSLNKNKTPYKTHLGIWMWQGQGAKFKSSFYYFHLEPPNMMLGVGIHSFSKGILQACREAVIDPVTLPALVKVVQDLSVNGGYQLGGEHYKRVPRGYDPDHPNAELLRYNGLTAGSQVPIPEEYYSAALLDYSYQKYADMYPIQHWLYELAQGLKGN
jgi:uncharacterized protein (TIGR02453 family)